MEVEQTKGVSLFVTPRLLFCVRVLLVQRLKALAGTEEQGNTPDAR